MKSAKSTRAKTSTPTSLKVLTQVGLVNLWMGCHQPWDGKPPTFNDGILIMGPYKPLWNWVDEFVYPLLYGKNGDNKGVTTVDGSEIR